jgi:hypothetical protein
MPIRMPELGSCQCHANVILRHNIKDRNTAPLVVSLKARQKVRITTTFKDIIPMSLQTDSLAWVGG